MAVSGPCWWHAMVFMHGVSDLGMALMAALSASFFSGLDREFQKN